MSSDPISLPRLGAGMSPAAPAARPAPGKGFPAGQGQLLGELRVPRNGEGEGTPRNALQRGGAGSCSCRCGHSDPTSSGPASVPAGAPALPAGHGPPVPGEFPRRPPHSPSPGAGLARPEFPGGRGAEPPAPPGPRRPRAATCPPPPASHTLPPLAPELPEPREPHTSDFLPPRAVIYFICPRVFPAGRLRAGDAAAGHRRARLAATRSGQRGEPRLPPSLGEHQ